MQWFFKPLFFVFNLMLLNRLIAESFFFLYFRFYKSLPPVTKFFGTACLASTVACQIGLLSPFHFALFYQLVFYNFQVKIATRRLSIFVAPWNYLYKILFSIYISATWSLFIQYIAVNRIIKAYMLCVYSSLDALCTF